MSHAEQPFVTRGWNARYVQENYDQNLAHCIVVRTAMFVQTYNGHGE